MSLAAIKSESIEDLFRSIFDGLPALVSLMTPDGTLAYANRHYLEYFGATVDELNRLAEGRGIIHSLHPEDRGSVHAAWRDSLETGQPCDLEGRRQGADGVYRWFRTRGSPLRDAQGRIVLWHVLQTDIEDAKRGEKLRADLAHVSRVTSLGALTASIAHEVNQPLSGIITNASTCLRMLAADPPNVDGARETARRMIRDGNRASAVIARLRALFSKKGAATESVDLNEATREVIALSLSEMQRSRVVLRTEFADDLPAVTGDRVQLQQVILNLLLNGSDAMSGVEDRPRHLSVRTARDTSNCVVTVQDAGVGFDPSAEDRLFEAFYTTKRDGMGIGLSVSRSIIEQHHGRLWAAPNEGPGATFSFSIPCEPS